ncbi:unnamed protein product [Sphenostylis stenocarpa]|uniref:GOLD domain-containing protein n=1 Tax=Sphenostylis stenocarpa TaxID=92480 RepID=A0AA86RN17_9FABA|nr:unnamed protein product [Sphenostylis stenocarpa]
MELELKKLNEAVTSIHDEMFYLRERYKFMVSAYKFTGGIGVFDLVNNVSPCDLTGIGEIEMQVLTNETNTKMFTFSFLSILVCLSVAGLQLWHLKTFFERKKLL